MIKIYTNILFSMIRPIDFGTGADEWFYFNGYPEKAKELTDKFIALDYSGVQISDQGDDYRLRQEQQNAVEKTYTYFLDKSNAREFLWNAKPRFGKRLTAFDFIRKTKGRHFLIVTNRPTIANSWYDDFHKFISWQESKLKFVSDSEALKGKAITYNEYVASLYKQKIKNKDIFTLFLLKILKVDKSLGECLINTNGLLNKNGIY